MDLRYFSVFTELWQGTEDSNPQPPDLESGALPVELVPFVNTINYWLFCFPMQGVAATAPTVFV